MANELLKQHFEIAAENRIKMLNRSRTYHKLIEKYISLIIPQHSNVIEIGCGTAGLLNSLKPIDGLGLDFSDKMIDVAKKNYPNLRYSVQEAETLQLSEKFDYVIMSDLVSSLWDVQQVFKNVMKISHKRSRIIITNSSYLWEPILKVAEFFKLKQKQPKQNWLSVEDITNLLQLEGFDVIRTERKILFPIGIPFLSTFFNSFLANLPLINRLCLTNIVIARPYLESVDDYSVSILIPARNERGNIEDAILRTPAFGSSQEFIFVEGHSSDDTFDKIISIKEKYPEKNIVAVQQTGKGKGNAVREGFDLASCDILMILDADLTMPPEDLVKYYNALASNKGEFINGCRLIYPMEKEAMRFLNLLANKFFGAFFSYIIGQKIKDTLCGTKVLFKEDYKRIARNRSFFGDFDPFGDFDLLFGASKLNLKIVDLPIRYKDRQYGSTQIRRFVHGWLLIKMSLFVVRKLKFK
jgi:ubiquinone/menaquinone biosynthesis C-methylase UbiE